MSSFPKLMLGILHSASFLSVCYEASFVFLLLIEILFRVVVALVAGRLVVVDFLLNTPPFLHISTVNICAFNRTTS